MSPRRSRRFANAPRTLALLASVSLFACENRDADETARGEQPASPGADEPASAQPGERPSTLRPSTDEADREQQEIAGRMGGEPSAPLDEPRSHLDEPTTPAPSPSTGMMGGESGKIGAPMGEMIEKTASVDMRTFERRLEDELGTQELTLAAAFDVPGQAKMRMFVVAPKDLSEAGGTMPPTEGGAMGGTPPEGGAMGGTPPEGGAMGGTPPEGGAMGDEPPAKGGAMGDTPPEGGAMRGDMPPSDASGGTMPRPQPGTQPGTNPGAGTPAPGGAMHEHAAGMGGEASTHARSALESSRLVVAYADENRPDQVTIAYMKSPMEAKMGGQEADQKLHAAIDRIVGEAMPSPDTKTDEERRG